MSDFACIHGSFPLASFLQLAGGKNSVWDLCIYTVYITLTIGING